MIKRILLAFALVLASLAPIAAPVAPAQAAPVANINVANAITALSRTSTSGDNSSATGLIYSISFSSAVHEGYFLHARVYSDSALTTLTQDVRHLLTHDDLQSGATINLLADGLTKLGPTNWIQFTVEKTSPNGLYYGYTYNTALSPTDAVSAMTWSATDKNVNVALSGGNLTATGSGCCRGSGVRGSRGLSSGKLYWEAAVAVPSGVVVVGVADASASLSDEWSSAGTATTHAAAWTKNDDIYYNGVSSGVGGFADGDNIDIALDVGAKKVWFRRNNGSWLPSGDPATGTGGVSMSSISTPIYPGAQISFTGSATVTANFGATSFTRTPPSGFVAP